MQSSPKAKKTKKGVTQLPKDYEKRLWQKGHQFVAGVDEAGRGPLAGPVRILCHTSMHSVLSCVVS